MKPLKIIHSDVGPESKAQKTKRISKTVLAIFLSLVVVTAAFFAVYAVSRALMGAQGDGKLKAGSTIEMTLASGEGCMLTLPEDVDIMDVTFTSSDERIARVDPAGKVDGLREGKAKITAEAGEFSAACDFTVTAADDSALPAEVTTAYTANSETLNKNKERRWYAPAVQMGLTLRRRVNSKPLPRAFGRRCTATRPMNFYTVSM